ncbi:MAG TPA: nucleotidyltransferase domain-containing protein, partial [Gemmataceae bacterium]|nr:nucleotidyltransferase domain-containing protein [Gemmataceae bacterium]
EVVELCRRFEVRTLELFGSASRGSWTPDQSDLDFLVDFQPMSPGAHSKAYFGLWFALEDLFGCGVDLVETGAVRNPFFIAEIDKARRILYAA